jgi:hypothetical protein
MIQVLILFGILLVLLIQFGIINTRFISKFFKRYTVIDDYLSDEESGIESDTEYTRRRQKKKRRHKRNTRTTYDNDSDSDDSISDKQTSFMTPIGNLVSQNPIRGSDILQKPDVPWQSTNIPHADENQVVDEVADEEAEAIQRQIMDELPPGQFNRPLGGSSQLTAMSL